MEGRHLLLLASIAVCAAGAWLVLGTLRPGWFGEAPPPIELVDTSRSIGELLDERAEQLGPRAEAEGPPETLVREPLPHAVARVFYPMLDERRSVYDPVLIVRRASHLESRRHFPEHPDGGWPVRTNAHGMREDRDASPDTPDLRILVTGDSHTEGLCPNEASFANVLEAQLRETRLGQRVEVLNAGVGAYNLYNYVAVLEKYSDLAPDVFVVAVYGGNDFASAVVLDRYFRGRGRQNSQPWNSATLLQNLGWIGIVAQELQQVLYFLNNPGDVRVAVAILRAMTREVVRQSQSFGAQALFVYLPPPLRGQPQLAGRELAPMLRKVGLSVEGAGVSDRIADAWIASMQREGVPHVDLRPGFRASEQRFYWETDLHLNLDGHRHVAETLRPVVEALAEAAEPAPSP